MRRTGILSFALVSAALACGAALCTSKTDTSAPRFANDGGAPGVARTVAQIVARDVVNEAAHDIVLRSEKIVVNARVAAGATLASLLRGEQVSSEDVATLVAKAAAVFDLRKVRANQPYRLERARDGVMQRFEYEIDGDRFLRVTRGSDDAL